MTVLIDTLFMIESFLGIETDTLMPFAEADNLGGYHPDPTQRQWGAGAIWDVEGRTIYALIRALKPVNVVEIGSGTGCSTNHIASALDHNTSQSTKVGHVVTLDRGNTPHIADHLQPLVTIVPGDAFEYLELLPDNSIDFILEDADHSENMCYRVGEIAKRKLAPGGVLVAHDAAHFGVGADVRAGFERAGLQGRVYLTEPSDCGLLLWRKSLVVPAGFGYTEDDPALAASLADTEPVLQAQEDKPKRKRKGVK
jgi:predicted O-methyltransferase YrrM